MIAIVGISTSVLFDGSGSEDALLCVAPNGEQFLLPVSPEQVEIIMLAAGVGTSAPVEDTPEQPERNEEPDPDRDTPWLQAMAGMRDAGIQRPFTEAHPEDPMSDEDEDDEVLASRVQRTLLGSSVIRLAKVPTEG
jgi:hypothetical protein